MSRKDLLKYVRTDMNGTKIFHDYTCPRCSGYGEAEKWAFTGKICYACGGSGISPTPKIVKEYTPEYEKKLEAQRAARAQKYADERAKYVEDHKAEIEAEQARIIKARYADNGCGETGIGYILRGNTYPKRAQIKKAGGRWIYGVWICPVDIEGEGIESEMIDLSGHIASGSSVWIGEQDYVWKLVQGGK